MCKGSGQRLFTEIITMIPSLHACSQERPIGSSRLRTAIIDPIHGLVPVAAQAIFASSCQTSTRRRYSQSHRLQAEWCRYRPELQHWVIQQRTASHGSSQPQQTALAGSHCPGRAIERLGSAPCRRLTTPRSCRISPWLVPMPPSGAVISTKKAA